MIPEHRFNSDGFCKDCGVREGKAVDQFCDGDDDPDVWLTPNDEAWGPKVAGYLAGLQYWASCTLRKSK